MKVLRASRLSLRKRLLKEAAEEKRRRFFDRIDNDDIRQTKDGVPSTYTPALLVYTLTARRNLVKIFNGVHPDGLTASQHDRRIEALQNLIDLCHKREPHHMNPASRASNDVKDLQDAFETMKLIPLALPSTICLFCLGDVDLTSEARTASFSRVDSLRRYVDELHLRHHVPDVPLICPILGHLCRLSTKLQILNGWS